MGSKPQTAEFVVDQLSPVGEIQAKKMFGEYGLYCHGVFFGLICDDRVFLKPTIAGREFIGVPIEDIPYPNARPHFLIDEQIDNGPWVCDLVRLTVHELATLAKPKRKK
jgi:TfoX/Sxy family transcriptional regulator of competence genes